MKKISVVIFSFLLIIGLLTAFTKANKNIEFDRNVPEDMVLIKGDQISGDFYICTHEVYNYEYLLYLGWINNVFEEYNLYYDQALPDSTVFQKQLSATYNDPLLNNYLRNPACKYYPVVGVSWIQANNFCIWKTSIFNENIVAVGGSLTKTDEHGANNTGHESDFIKNPNDSTTGFVVEYQGTLPKLRLPTEYEWEMAYNYVSANNISKELTLQTVDDFKKCLNPDCYFNYPANFKEKKIDNMPSDIFKNTSKVLGMDNNVSEWVVDSYYEGQGIVKSSHKDIYKKLKEASKGITDIEIMKNENKLYRGGSFMDAKDKMKRGFKKSGQSSNDLGFRYVMSKAD